jgi:hypothetical protein
MLYSFLNDLKWSSKSGHRKRKKAAIITELVLVETLSRYSGSSIVFAMLRIPTVIPDKNNKPAMVVDFSLFG